MNNSHLYDRYLRLLGVSPKKPSREALLELTRAQLTRVPFENISKLYYRKKDNLHALPDFERYLDGIEHFHFGGTCYPNNYYLHMLLKYLGYDADLCGADMTNPDVHIVNIVRVEGHEYIVDGGYGAPFLDPMPRDLRVDYKLALGGERYILKPKDSSGRSRLELYRNSEKKHGYNVNPIPRSIEHFENVIADSFRDQATFMNALLLVRFYPDRSTVIHNLTVIDSVGVETKKHQLKSRDPLPIAIENHFGIPKGITTEAISELGELNDAWA